MVRWLALALAAVALAIGACTLLDDGPPDGRCESDQDCFRAQGESCNVETHECEVVADGGIDAR